MKAFLVGLIFLIAAGLLGALGVILFPLLLLMALFMRIVVILALLIIAIWILGKFIIYVWEKMRNHDSGKKCSRQESGEV